MVERDDIKARLEEAQREIERLTAELQAQRKYVLQALTDKDAADAARERAYGEALADVEGQWFTQGGKMSFHDDRMLPPAQNADELVSHILSAVRAHVDQLTAARERADKDVERLTKELREKDLQIAAMLQGQPPNAAAVARDVCRPARAYEFVASELGIRTPADLRRFADRDDTVSTLRERCLFRWVADQWEAAREQSEDMDRCKFLNGRCLACGEPESGMCGIPPAIDTQSRDCIKALAQQIQEREVIHAQLLSEAGAARERAEAERDSLTACLELERQRANTIAAEREDARKDIERLTAELQSEEAIEANDTAAKFVQARRLDVLAAALQQIVDLSELHRDAYVAKYDELHTEATIARAALQEPLDAD